MDLFDDLPEMAGPKRPEGKVRVQAPIRDQVELVASALDDLIGGDHQARRVWSFVERLDLTVLYAQIRVREGTVGRPAIDPRILLALWLYATIDGIGAARALARLCANCAPYRWLCGGVSVNYHTLADFRVDHVAFLDEVLAQSLAALVSANLVDMQEMAQDGVRVRASAGASSFRRRPALQKALRAARKRIEQLKAEIDDDPDAGNRRRRAAQERAAHETEARIAKALKRMEELERERANAKDKSKARKEPRVSTTDSEARIIKMADGGFRPAWNCQIVSAGQAVIAVEPGNSSSDRGLMRPMIERVRNRLKLVPRRYLVDGGFTDLGDIEWAASAEGGRIKVHCPLTKSKHKTPPEKIRRNDGPGIIAWRRRMASPTGKAVYKRRAPCECIHAHFRRRGLTQILVRGLDKVRAVLLWHGIAQNLTLLAKPA